ncbi:MAG: glucosylceramidase [Bacteroidetes bacterium]|nr:glucosylceramidase [Bacteroidota bacterium]
MKNKLLFILGFTVLVFQNEHCFKRHSSGNIQVWTTSADGQNLLSQASLVFVSAADNRLPILQIDTTQHYQAIEGFGYTMTGGSAKLLVQMGAAERTALLRQFFGTDSTAIGVSYLRISIGASDLDAEVFSYDDLPAGQTDTDLSKFSIAKDEASLIPVLKEVLAINPNMKFMGSPWSPPSWMKNNGSSMGGNLNPAYYSVYAQYFVKYIQAYKAHGISIDAVTIQNEPHHGGNNPSMVMSSAQQAAFIKTSLGPAFRAAGISTKIIVWDHNCDEPNYPIEVLSDPAAKEYVQGSAFHLYAGDEAALSAVHDTHPDKALYFTEQWTGKNGDFGGDLMWHIRHVIIGTMRNWSQVALEWNLANDPNFGPHTPGGCTECRGAVTIDGNAVTKNVSYYIIGQASKFVTPGSVRLGSNIPNEMWNVAFRRPDGKTVLIVLNEASAPQSFNIQLGRRYIKASLQGKTVGTFVW